MPFANAIVRVDCLSASFLVCRICICQGRELFYIVVTPPMPKWHEITNLWMNVRRLIHKIFLYSSNQKVNIQLLNIFNIFANRSETGQINVCQKKT